MTTSDLSEFEATGEPLEVERRPRSGAVVSVRLSADEAEHLMNLATQRRMTVSALGREAILAYIQRVPSARLAAATWTGATNGNTFLQIINPTNRPIIRTDGAPVESQAR